jgi:hypothetical protein
MNKTLWMRRYLKISIVIGFLLLWNVNNYVNDFTNEIYGVVTKGFFQIKIENYFDTVTIFNLPMIVFFVLTIFNVLIQFYLATSTEENPSLKDVAFTNALITFAMLLGQFLFTTLVPDTINGVISNKIFFVEMPRLSTDIINVFNTNYVFAFGYILYNMYVLIKTMPPKEENDEGKEEYDFVE